MTFIDKLFGLFGIKTNNIKETEKWNKGICLECGTPYERFAEHGYELSRATVYKCGCSEEHHITITGDADEVFPARPVPEIVFKTRDLIKVAQSVDISLIHRVVLKDLLSTLNGHVDDQSIFLKDTQIEKVGDNVALTYWKHFGVSKDDVLVKNRMAVRIVRAHDCGENQLFKIVVRSVAKDQRSVKTHEFEVKQHEIEGYSDKYQTKLYLACNAFIETRMTAYWLKENQ